MTHNDQTETYCVLAPGLQVGRYRLNQKIGWGGMGEVYACDDLESDRRVALKFLRADYASEGTARQRFEREAKAAAVEAEEAGVESGQKGFLSLAFIMKGWGKFLRGDGRQAQRLLTDATAMAAGGTFAWEEAVARYYHGLVRYHSREYVSARSCFVAARNVAMPGRFDEIVLMADMHLAAMAAQQDDTGAIEQLRQGVRRGEGTWLELPIRRLLAVSLASQSDAALRGEGRQMLADIKERARHAPYPLESNFIQSAIESLY